MEEIESDEEGEGGGKGWREWEREGEGGSNGVTEGKGERQCCFLRW